MRIIRPQQLVVVKGGYQIGDESRLGISVIAGCYLSRPAHFVSEAQIWEAWKAAPLSLPVLDAAEPKPFAEYLIAGHAGIGKPVKTLNVSADIGGLSRRWRVEGEGRHGAIGAAPFLSIPLDHPSAWGGEGVKENPLGRGSGDGLRPLIMTLGADGAAQEHSPLAAPAPVPHEFLLRKLHIDKVAGQMSGKAYLESIFPGLPKNIDRRYFQMAAPAQWLPEPGWPDNIPFRLQGFRAETLSGELPAVAGKAFIRRRDCDRLESVALQRKTLWFLPDSDIALMIFTGSVPIEHLLDETIELLMGALDRCDAPRSEEYFNRIVAKRSDEDASPFEFLFDPDLMPDGMGLNIIETAADHPSSLRFGPEATSIEASTAFYQRIREAIAAHQRQQQPIAEMDWDTLPQPPDDNEADLLYQDAAILEDKNFRDVSFDGLLTGKTFLQCRFEKCIFSRATFTDCAFERCVFIACDLTSSTLQNVRMRYCTLLQSALSGSRWRDAALDNVTMEAPVGSGMQMVNSVMNYCVFNQGALDGSRLETCNISNGMFNHTSLARVELLQGRLDASVFNRCTAEEVISLDMAMSKNSLLGGLWRRTRFEKTRIESLTVGMQADFTNASFSDCSFTNVGMKQASMAGCQLVHCAFTDSNFDQADLTASQITACDMAGGRFKDSVLAYSRWHNTSLQQGMLYNADLRNAGFSQCNLAAANMAMTWQDAETRFSDCLLERACWVPRRLLSGGALHDR